MSTGTASQMSSYFRVLDGVRVRVRRHQGGLRHDRGSAGAVAGKPVGLPPHLGPPHIAPISSVLTLAQPPRSSSRPRRQNASRA